MYYSVFQTAMRNGLDPAKYLSYILTQCTQNPDRLDDRDFMESLLVWNPEIMRRCADIEHREKYNDPEWMEDFQRRLREEEVSDKAFISQIEEALKQQQENLDTQQKTIKTEAVRKRKKTIESRKRKKQEKQKLIDTFNDNKSALSPVPVPAFNLQDCNSSPINSVQLE